jgi:hypothetical protein
MGRNFFQRMTKIILRRIIRSTVKRTENDGADEVFGRTWASLSSNRFYLWVLRRYASDKEHFCINDESLKYLVRNQPELFSSVKVSASPEFIDLVRGAAPFVAVQVHDGAPNLTKLIVDQKRPLSRIVGAPSRHLKRLNAMQIDTSYVNLVERDVRSFFRLRAAAGNGHVICCAIDYRGEDGKWAYLNPAIFGFAMQQMLPVIFVRKDVDSLGCVHIRTSKPHMVTDPVSSAAAFLEFYNSIPGKKIDLIVKRYHQ